MYKGNITGRRFVLKGTGKRKSREEWKLGSIWNPMNLQKEVHRYGYNFEWKAYLLTIFFVFLLIGVVGMFFKLRISYIVAVGVVALSMLPVLIIDMYRRMFEQKRFADATDYMEQILFSFRKERKILPALRECETALPDGQMRAVIREAAAYIEAGNARTEEGVYPEALALIEKKYACKKIHTVHELLISAEERGGDVSTSIDLMVEDIEVWKRQVYELQKDKKVGHTDCIFSIVGATLTSGLAVYLMDQVKSTMGSDAVASIFTLLPVQLTSFVLILICLFTFAGSNRKLVQDWMDGKKKKDVLHAYEYLTNYDAGKEGRRSILLSLPFLIIAIICVVLDLIAVAIIFAVLAVFMLFQHKVNCSVYRSDVKNALYEALPEWMFDMALLLQYNNVQVSLAESVSHAEPILQAELTALVERIRKDPDEIQSYLLFFANVDIPEIATCMKMLYSMSNDGTGNMQVQISNLVAHVNKLREKELELKNEKIVFQERMMVMYPVAATTVKLLVDMASGTVLLFQLFGTMI